MTRRLKFQLPSITAVPDDGSVWCLWMLAAEHGCEFTGAGDTFTLNGDRESVEAFMMDLDREFGEEVSIIA